MPKKWQTELIDHVTWWTRKIRTAPPHSAASKAPRQVPVTAKPIAAGIAIPTATHSGNVLWMSCMPRSSWRSRQ